ncbi:MAG: hypothetical protein ABI778_00120 [Ignavibacteriota bacterium]
MKRLVNRFVKRFLVFLCSIIIYSGFGLTAHGQGMPIDSLTQRFELSFSKEVLSTLHDQIPIRYDEQRVWGLAIGDFSNDSLPDLALSVYDIDSPTREVTVYLLVNDANKAFKNVFRKKYIYVETPIEVGLSTDGSVVTVVQKSDDQQWNQEGYTVYAGDVILIDDYETQNEEIPAVSPKAKAMGHSRYRNYESLFTKDLYFATKDGQLMMDGKYYSFPAYSRLRSVYPGYGRDMRDTSKQFIIKGGDNRRDASDLSIHRALTAYDDEFLYFSISVTDDQVWGGNEKQESNDRVSLWFDTWQSANRFLLKAKKGAIPNFRTETDSNIYNITFTIPEVGGRSAKATLSSAVTLSEAQQEAGKLIRSVFNRDTANGIVTGYTLKARIPFAFLGFESNPVTAFENRASEMMFDREESKTGNKKDRKEDLEYPFLGFTAVVNDIDNPSHPEEVTMQATSNLRQNDPTSFGEIRLIPSGKYYGWVKPTYVKEFTEELIRAGY